MEQEMVGAKKVFRETGAVANELERCADLVSSNESGDGFDSKTKSKEPFTDETVVELSKLDAVKKGISSEKSVEVENAIGEKLGGEVSVKDGAARTDPRGNVRVPADNIIQTRSKNAVRDEVLQGADEVMVDAAPDKADKGVLKEQKQVVAPSTFVTPLPRSRGRPCKAGAYTDQRVKPVSTPTAVPLTEEDDGTPEEQAAFIEGLKSFFKERGSDFKPPKFYQHPLNCLKLWRSVIKLGGYETVTAYKLWRLVGESFNPPKTCTTISWTFRIFYEKTLLEYEKHKIQSGELILPATPASEASGVAVAVAVVKEIPACGNSHQGLESGRVRRDAAARAMQGWHSQRYGKVSEPVAKDKAETETENENGTPNCKKNFKSIGSLKQKRPHELEISNKVARIEMSEQLVASVIDVGPPADWVKVNVRPTTDCFEVYALVPGLLREEVRVQSDPAGRLVITGQPEEIDNPWGVTPFRKVVSLPARIDPLNTSAVVSLHGGLFVRVPYEQ